MMKKVALGILLAGLIGVLVAGAVVRTVDKTGQVAEARGLESGQGYGKAADHEAEDCDEGGASDGQGRGYRGGEAEGTASGGGGYGQGGGAGEPQTSDCEVLPEDWVVYEGTVVQAPVNGEELVIQTSAGEEITVGTGPRYMEAQGFALQAGELVQVQGYWEGSELKAAQVTRLRDGQTITLRDGTGRPAWAGQGRRAQGGTQGGSQGGG